MLNYPKAKRTDVKDDFHGVSVADPYRWLEQDSDEREAWLDAQENFMNDLCRPAMDTFKPRIKNRLEDLMRTESMGMPIVRGQMRFFMKREPNQELAVFYFQKTRNSEPVVLVDPNKWSDDKKITLSGVHVSPKGNFVAYSFSNSGNDKNFIRLLDVATGKTLTDSVSDELYPSFLCWDREETGFWYTRRFPKDVPVGMEKQYQCIFFHKIGDHVDVDELVFGQTENPKDYRFLSVSDCNRYLIYWILFPYKSDNTKNIFLFDREDPQKGLCPIFLNDSDEHALDICGQWLYDLTNAGAPNCKIVRCKISDIFSGNLDCWQTVVLDDQNKSLTEMDIVGNEMYLHYLHSVASRVLVYNLDGGFLRELRIPQYSTFSGISFEEGSDEMFYGISNFLVRHDIFRVDRNSGKVELFYRHDKGLDPEKFIVKQLWYKSKDGTNIPMFVLHRKDILLDGKNPTMLYGYGGFRISIPPGFSSNKVPFLESGGIYAIANIRGGSEFGEEWFLQGILNKKQNVFDDFIAGAEFLISKGYTCRDKLSIFGWSNGGLLTSACVLQRPDLFKVVVVGAPVADMMRYAEFDGGWYWTDNYGDPKNNKEDFEASIKYSPVHNVKFGEQYPATLVVTADHDDRTHPMHAFKFLASMQYSSSSDNPIVMLLERQAGHSGAASVSNAAEQYADIWSFVFWQLGMKY